MIKIDIISGFLGAGKTTLIKKLLSESLKDERVVLIENEFGEIGIDGGFLQEAGIEIMEMNSGCICCSLVGDFETSLREVMNTYTPERILIEPSGVGKLSDVIKAVEGVTGIRAEGEKKGRSAGVSTSQPEATLNSLVTVVDAAKCRMYLKNFGEFFIDQVGHAETIILSRTDKIGEARLLECVEMLRGYNQKAVIITTPWEDLEGQIILAAMEKSTDLKQEILDQIIVERRRLDHHGDKAACCCGHDHGDGCHGHDGHDHSDGCHGHAGHDHSDGCHGHDGHGHGGGCHGHDGHGHGGGCHGHGGQGHGGGCHGHDGHDHGDGCHGHDGQGHGGGCHGHGEHHPAEEVCDVFGVETPMMYGKAEVEDILAQLSDEARFGTVLRAKGMVASGDAEWIHFDYVPGEANVRSGSADITGKICVIGAGLKTDALKALWRKEGRA
ncbi:MAG: cobalamin biosynthesis protein CobW [Lachnospiraceae bacterium]|jgi:G3E family GTPase|nr:cobalamin biosynthesis protein CobW [Lachnospiraceae bacterium]